MDLQVNKEIDLFANLDAIHIAHIASIGEERVPRTGLDPAPTLLSDLDRHLPALTRRRRGAYSIPDLL